MKQNMLHFAVLLGTMAAVCSGEEKWAWPSSDRDQRGFADRRDSDYYSRIRVPTSYDDEDYRNEEQEQTTKRPVAADEYDAADDPRVNYPYNGYGPYGGNGGGIPPYGGNGPVPPYGGGAGVPPYGGGGSLIPSYGPNGGVPPNGGYPRPNPLYPNPNKGILVGPGGPTGMIGRRPKYFGQKGNPANGILVGPGGPIDIPPGSSAGPPYPFPGQRPGFGGGPYGPGGRPYGPGGSPYGPGGSILPYNNNVGGGGIYASEQDELSRIPSNDSPRNVDNNANKKVLKKRSALN